MLRATTTVQRRSVAQSSLLRIYSNYDQSLRHKSFKAFAKRNEEAATSKSKGKPAIKPADSTANADKTRDFANVDARNETGRFSRHNNRNHFGNRNNDNRSLDNRRGNAFFTSRNSTRPPPSANRPWERQRQKDDNPPQRENRSFFKSKESSSFSTNSFSAKTKRYTPLFEKDVEDLKDISALRNTFMPNRPKSESWRAAASDPDTLIGKKFTPSFYTPKKPATLDNPTSPQINENQSLEQVLRNNAAARREDMAQRYRNAGEAVPSNLQENPRYSWRQPRTDHRGGGYQRQQHHQRRQQDNRFQQPNRFQQKTQFGRRLQGQKFQRPWARRQKRQPLPSSVPKEMKLPNTPMTLVDFSRLLRVKKGAIVRTLRALGEQVSYRGANQDGFKIDPEMMEYICVDMGIEPIKTEQKVSSVEEAERRAMRQSSQDMDEEERTEEEEKYAALPPRSPVVSIMGHVDHGKTTLMDALRRRAVTMNSVGGGGKKKESKKKKKTKARGGKGVTFDSDNVAGTEAGGITQVITAFEVPLPLDESSGDDETGNKTISTVTFLDTPGHAAFKKMRQSGSHATDVIVLVVAADDGVSPQTVEIIDMFKSIARSQPQSISLVIAVSKIDKHGIDIDEAVMRIENQLIEHEIFTENVLAGGGDEGEFGACQLFPVSGITGEGLDDLVEGLALQSELMDLRADDEARGEGIVIDARMEKGLGVVADCVIRWGKVEPGDFLGKYRMDLNFISGLFLTSIYTLLPMTVSGTNGGKVRFLNDGKSCRSSPQSV